MRILRISVIAILSMGLAGCQLLPGGGARDDDAARTPPRIDRAGSTGPSPVDQQCLARLGQSGASYSPLPSRYDAPGCTQINAVSLTALQGDASRFAIGNIGPVTCATLRHE